VAPQLVGADLDRLDALARFFDGQAGLVERVGAGASADIAALGRIWVGADAGQFATVWQAQHRAALANAVAELQAAAETVRRNRAAQELASGADGGLPGGGGATGFLLGDAATFWRGDDDTFPYGSVAAGLLRVWRTASFTWGTGPFPVFNTGLVGQGLSAGLQRVPALAPAGAWLATDSATLFFRRAGIVGAVASTGMGLYDLYQQGNPIDAFRADGAGYVADVANTAFSASTAAFLIAPNPVTGALVVGTGLVWAGAEVVDHWDDISSAAGDAWDWGTGALGGGWDWGTDTLGDVWETGTSVVGDAVGDVWDVGTGALGDTWDAVSDWF